MTYKLLVAGGAIAAALALATLGGAPASAQGYGPGMGPGGGPGMMQGQGPGYGRGMGWQGGCPRWADGGGRGYGRGGMRHGRGWGQGNDSGWRQGRGGGPGYGPGARQGFMGPAVDLKLTTTDVKTRMDQWMVRRANPRLKVGDIKERDADTIVADIVTKDNSLVDRIVVNRHTGYFQRNGE
jgi:hypothetical protein